MDCARLTGAFEMGDPFYLPGHDAIHGRGGEEIAAGTVIQIIRSSTSSLRKTGLADGLSSGSQRRLPLVLSQNTDF